MFIRYFIGSILTYKRQKLGEGGGGRAWGEVGAGEKDIKGGWAYKGGGGVAFRSGGSNLLYTMNRTH